MNGSPFGSHVCFLHLREPSPLDLGSSVDGRRIDDLDELPESAWISVIVRRGRLVPVNRGTWLHAGDEIVVFAEADLSDSLRALVEGV